MGADGFFDPACIQQRETVAGHGLESTVEIPGGLEQSGAPVLCSPADA
ncbi:hypothetical protein [Streptomyces sp. NBC_01594]